MSPRQLRKDRKGRALNLRIKEWSYLINVDGSRRACDLVDRCRVTNLKLMTNPRNLPGVPKK